MLKKKRNTRGLLAKQGAGKLKCYKVNTDESPSIATRYGIMLCLVLRKFEGKCRERKYKGKVERKKKQRKIKNILKVDKLFFLLLQTHFIYFNSSI